MRSSQDRVKYIAGLVIDVCENHGADRAFAHYLGTAVVDRITSGRSTDCDEYRALLKMREAS